MRIKGLVVARAGEREFRAAQTDDGTLGTMFVRFSPFDTWYEINSLWEGNFLERTVPGAFKNTINANKRGDGTFAVRSLFDHGMDFNIGDKILGVPNRFEEVREDGYHGPVLEVPLLDTSYNRDLLPGLRAGGYGSSFMFESIREEWNHEPGESEHNPNGIPERTLVENRVHEAGPVTWPASPTADAGMRSRAMTDSMMERMATRHSGRYDDLVRCMQAFRAAHKIPDQRLVTPTPTVDEDAVRRQAEVEREQRTQLLREYRLRLMRAGK